MKKAFVVVGAVVLVLILAGISGDVLAQGERTSLQAQLPVSPKLGPSSSMKIDADFGRMPVYFIPNQGQMDKRVAYYVQGKDKAIYFTDEGIILVLMKPDEEKGVSSLGARPDEPDRGLQGRTLKGETGGAERWAVKLDFVDANRHVRPVGEAKTGAVVSYFKGKPEEWRTGLPTYSQIAYRNLWPGIDLVYYGTVNRLKYEFIVHPGADPSKIRLAYWGAEKVSIDGEGRLQVTTPVGGFSDDVPVAYQEVRGERVAVFLAYKLSASSEVGKNDDHSQAELGTIVHPYGFAVGAYDATQTLVLDPAILAYCGYIGGSSNDYGYGIAVDGSGNAYVTGLAYSAQATPSR
jgi:hypothetical protein